MARLQSGTRIYGTANVDTSIGVGGNVVVNTSVLTIGNSSVNVVVNSSSIYVSGSPVGAGGAANQASQYSWTNTQTFSNTITFTGAILANTINAASHTVGTAVSINATAMAVNAYSIGSVNTATFYNINGQANASAGAFVGNAYATLGGASGNYLAFGQQTSSAQWIQSGYSSAGAPVYYSIILNPLGGNIGIGNTAPTDRLSVNGNTYLQGTVNITGAVNAAAYTVGTNFISNTTQLTISGTPVSANGGVGTAGQVLTSNGSTGSPYWSTASGGGFTNGQSISVANLAITGSLTANGSVGTSGQALISTGTGVQWGALSPGYNYSSQFNGSSQYLSIPNNALFNFGSGAFTVELWAYFSSVTGYRLLVSNYGGTTTGWTIQTNNTSNLGVCLSGDGFDIIGSTTLQVNTWYHIALSGSSGSIKLFINGVQEGSTYTGAIALDTSAALTIGQNTGTYFSGFISNLRLIKGTALYTSNFTVPTSPLTAISGTSLLTCNAITPTSDSSSNNLAITNNGAVTTTATLSPFTSTTVSIPTAALTAVRQQFTGDGTTTTFAVAGGYTANAISVFVNGVLLRNGTDVTVTNGSTIVFAIAPLSGALIDVIGTVPTTYSSITPVSYSVGFASASSQYLSIPANAAFQMTADFTIECWAYVTSFATSPTLVDQYVNGTTGAGNWQICVNTSGVVQVYYNGSTSFNSSTISLNTWYHFALVRIGSSLVLYINGVAATTVSYSGTLGRSDTTFWIGSQHASGPINYWNGYVSNFRVVKGLGVYTGNFTVPTSPLQATQSASGAYIQAISGTQTSLLTCNGPTIVDSSTNAFTITNNGSAPVSTAIVPTFTNVTITNPQAFYSASYLIVAGGGGGGRDNWSSARAAGGGGAGGMITGTTTLVTGITYPFVVGAGGSGGGTDLDATGTNGTNSSGFGYNVLGGGGGGGHTLSTAGSLSGNSGGSGGGGSNGGTGGAGTTGQGNAGGAGSSSYSGGGGGGAGAVGSAGSGSTSGAGGVGTASSITGASVTYAGGGGGYGTGGGAAGGTGGGGAGGGTAGTVNTGGGGGGNRGVAGAGGSGVVILSIPIQNYTGITTGSPILTTVGSNRILTFTASGSYTA